ncbi:MAG: class II aldolase/adducin family protein [Pseudomonadota bacterium]
MNTRQSETQLQAPRSREEQQLRSDLAACYRLIDLYGMSDGILNHISARVPGDDMHFLINPFGMMYEEITASSLIKLDLDGRIIENPNPHYTVNLPGYVIHSAIHGARHDVTCVLHTHTPAGMAVSSLACGLLPLNQSAMRFAGSVAYHDFEGVAVDTDERKRLVEHLGDSDVMILRNHGLLAVGQTVAEAFVNMHRLERACQTQLLAMAANSKLIMPEPALVDKTFSQLRRAPTPDATGRFPPHGEREWPALLRKLDRTNPGYRD